MSGTGVDADDYADPHGPAARAAASAQAAALAAQAAKGGLRFEVWLEPSTATWMLERIAAGDFIDPVEATNHAFQDMKELSRHPRVRQALLSEMISAALEEPRTDGPVLIEEIMAELEANAGQEAAAWPARARP